MTVRCSLWVKYPSPNSQARLPRLPAVPAVPIRASRMSLCRPNSVIFRGSRGADLLTKILVRVTLQDSHFPEAPALELSSSPV